MRSVFPKIPGPSRKRPTTPSEWASGLSMAYPKPFGTRFAKELRANSGRNFLMAPFALLNVLMMPLAILLDITPFVQILLVLWNFGFVMNQVLTIHALNTYLESSGFYAIPGALGGAAAASLCLTSPV